MPEYLTQNEAFLKCKRSGKFIVLEEIDLARVKSAVSIAESDVDAADSLRKLIKVDSNQWNSVYKLYYDALHELIESFLKFEKIKVENHQCLFSYFCEKHPEFEFNWELFEKARTKRNGIHYYGTPVNYQDWKDIELAFTLYLKKLKEEIKKKIAEQEKLSDLED
jgi:hypothetical protein